MNYFGCLRCCCGSETAAGAGRQVARWGPNVAIMNEVISCTLGIRRAITRRPRTHARRPVSVNDAHSHVKVAATECARPASSARGWHEIGCAWENHVLDICQNFGPAE